MPGLAVVPRVEARLVQFSEKLADHEAILRGYIDTHITRNHSDKTLAWNHRFLSGWFAGIMVPDENHPDGRRQLFVWEAMEPVVGRERIVAFSKGLIKAELEVGTVTTYMGSLRRLFGYVLAFPYIPKIVGAGSNNGAPPPSIVAKYGPIEQPVLEYDYPHHVIDPEEEGLTLTGEKLVEFYNFVRFEYIGKKPKKLAVSRDYTAIVIAGEGGLRVDELRHLDAFGARQDLFFEGGRIQTRFGKAAKGSGKRVRKTIFTPFAQATVHAYLRDIRPHFPNANSDPALFLSNKGSRISYGAMWSNLQGIAAAAREAGFVFPSRFGHHSLRKSFATNFLQQNPDQFWVLMDMMGHMDPSTLYRYLKYSRSHYDRIQDQILAELCPATPAKEP